MLVKVTQKHIDAGERQSCIGCPIALAIKELYTGNKSNVKVDVDKCIVGGFDLELPKEAINFIADFDDRRPVKPFEFEL